MKIFTLTVTPQPIVPSDTNLTNVRDVYITNTGSAAATLQFDGEPVGSNALGSDAVLSAGVGYLLAAGQTLPLLGGRPGSRSGSYAVYACSAAATSLAVQIIIGNKTLP
jgi:hypothetical protein